MPKCSPPSMLMPYSSHPFSKSCPLALWSDSRLHASRPARHCHNVTGHRRCLSQSIDTSGGSGRCGHPPNRDLSAADRSRAVRWGLLLLAHPGRSEVGRQLLTAPGPLGSAGDCCGWLTPGRSAVGRQLTCSRTRGRHRSQDARGVSVTNCRQRDVSAGHVTCDD